MADTLGTGIVSDEAAAEMADPPRAPLFEREGYAGDGPQWGVIYDEANANLRGADWATLADKMRRRCPTVSLASLYLQNFLFSATWGVEGEGEPADYLRDAFGLDGHTPQMGRTFEAFLRDAYTAIELGFAYFEEVYRSDGSRVWLEDFCWRDQRAHYRWVTDTRGRLAGVEQWAVDARGMAHQVTIPLHKLTLFTWRGIGHNYEGIGGFRPLQSYYQDQTYLLNCMRIAVQRGAVAAPVVEWDVPLMRTEGYSDAEINAERSSFNTQLKNFTAGNQNYIAKPAERFCKVEPWSASGAFDPEKFVPALQWYDHTMARMFMAQVLDLGTGASGSRAVASEHTEAAIRFGVNALEWFRESLQPCIDRLLGWNFGDIPHEDRPRLVFHGLKTEPFVQRLESLPGLAAAGLLTPNEEVIAETHRKLGLPVPAAGSPVAVPRLRRRARDILREGE
jgi:hypothetical protein